VLSWKLRLKRIDLVSDAFGEESRNRSTKQKAAMYLFVQRQMRDERERWEDKKKGRGLSLSVVEGRKEGQR
jgi:hypothetical protein